MYGGDPEKLQDARVLVVDDNATNRLIVTEMLAACGMRPAPVDGGPAALAALKEAVDAENPFALVVSDVQMPVMDGFALAEEIRRNLEFGAVPMLVLSSSAQRGEGDRCRKLGIAAYLVKPVQPSELIDAVVDALSRRVEPNAELTRQPRAAAPMASETSGGGMKILLAEDNAVNRKLATKLLEKHGYAPVVAEDGKQALEALEREKVRLILMDVQMPVMDGFEAIRTIRKRETVTGEHMPIIALTAHAMKGDRERCLEAGADDYVTKPIRTPELLAAILRLTEAAAPATSAERQKPALPSDEPAKAVFDTNAALERVENDRDLLEEILHIFSEESVQNAAQIHAAAEARDAHLLERLAHTVKGAAANIGGVLVSDAARALEQTAREGSLDAAGPLIEELDRQLQALLPELDSFCKKVPHA